MLFLSPAKLLLVLVVALTVLGPDALPKVARQIGGFWGEFKGFRRKLESEVRGSFPDLPSTETITQAVRSPLTFLDTLAETHAVESGEAPPGTNPAPQVTAGVAADDRAPVMHHGLMPDGPLDDPAMN